MAQTKTASKTSRAKKPAKASAAKKGAKAPAKKKATKSDVTVDRRRTSRRKAEEAKAEESVEGASPAPEAAPKLERRQKTNRRRQIDPTTCERDYTDGEVEFMNALDAYKRSSGRMFPTCSEVLEVIRDLGYVRLSPAELAFVKEQRGEIDEPTDQSLEDTAEAEAAAALEESDELRRD